MGGAAGGRGETEPAQNVRALILHKMGNFFVNGTDHLIISKFLGLLISGVYDNYLLIVKSIRGFTYLIFNSLTASVGNLNATESKDEVVDRFQKIYFLGYWLTTFCAVSLLCLLNPFIDQLWGRTFEMPVVIVIVLNFYLAEMRNPVMIFKDALGLYWQDRYKPLFESAVNIIASLFLGRYLGILGVLIGTALSAVLVVCWLEPLVLYRFGFLRPVGGYFARYLRDAVAAMGICCATLLLCESISGEGWLGIVERALFCTALPNLLLWLLYHKTKEYRYFWKIAVSIIGSLKNQFSSGYRKRK